MKFESISSGDGGGGVGPQIQGTGDIPDRVDSASGRVAVLRTDSGIQSVSPTDGESLWTVRRRFAKWAPGLEN